MVYTITKFWFYPVLSLFIGKIKGKQNIPTRGNFIIISNHFHLIDPLLIIYPMLKKLNKKIHFLAKPSWWFLGETFCRKYAGCIPLFDSKQAYNEIKEYIKKGKIIGIFPQGDYKKGNNTFKTGVIRLALETNTPILPIGIKSSYTLFSSALNMRKLIHLEKNKKTIEQKAEDLMSHVYQLKNEID